MCGPNRSTVGAMLHLVIAQPLGDLLRGVNAGLPSAGCLVFVAKEQHARLFAARETVAEPTAQMGRPMHSPPLGTPSLSQPLGFPPAPFAGT